MCVEADCGRVHAVADDQVIGDRRTGGFGQGQHALVDISGAAVGVGGAPAEGERTRSDLGEAEAAADGTIERQPQTGNRPDCAVGGQGDWPGERVVAADGIERAAAATAPSRNRYRLSGGIVHAALKAQRSAVADNRAAADRA